MEKKQPRNKTREKQRKHPSSCVLVTQMTTDFGCFERKLKSDGNARSPYLTKIYCNTESF